MNKRNKPTDIEILLDRCDRCGTCIGICPPNVINLVQDDIFINFANCTYCALCIDVCPIKAISGKYE